MSKFSDWAHDNYNGKKAATYTDFAEMAWNYQQTMIDALDERLEEWDLMREDRDMLLAQNKGLQSELGLAEAFIDLCGELSEYMRYKKGAKVET